MTAPSPNYNTGRRRDPPPRGAAWEPLGAMCPES